MSTGNRGVSIVAENRRRQRISLIGGEHARHSRVCPSMKLLVIARLS